MKYGFIKVAAASPALRVADCRYNAEKSAEMMKQAAAAGAHLLVLPELGLTGYTCGDLLLQPTLIAGAQDALQALLEESRALSLTTVAGLPLAVEGKLYNCAAVLHRGQLLGIVPKLNLPNYGEFYEERWFTPAPAEVKTISLLGQEVPFGSRLLFCCRELPEYKLAVELCEDLWVASPPSIRHAVAGATVIANCSASDETIGKAEYRRSLVTGQSARLMAGYLYADAGRGESTTDMVFAGHDLIAENGKLLAETALFTNDLILTELDVHRLFAERRRTTTWPAAETSGYTMVPFSLPMGETTLTRFIDPHPFVPADDAERRERCETILAMQAEGLRRRLEHIGCPKAVLGISGGLDSTLALLVAVRALDLLGRPRTDMVAVTMPGFGTTARTRSNAEILCERLGVTLRTISIAAAVRQHFCDIGHDESVTDVTYENAQARERTQILMDIANQQNGIVVGTGDLSELALGWATYNGDHMSMYGVNGSIPKTLVRHLVRHAADTCGEDALAAVLYDILDTPVSPELLPAGEDGTISQKTEDLVGPYELHDFFLYHFFRYGCPPAKILHLAETAFAGQYDRATLLKWLRTFFRRFFQQQFKRSCLPDGPKVGSVSLSPRGDWRMPSDAAAALWLQELDCLQ